MTFSIVGISLTLALLTRALIKLYCTRYTWRVNYTAKLLYQLTTLKTGLDEVAYYFFADGEIELSVSHDIASLTFRGIDVYHLARLVETGKTSKKEKRWLETALAKMQQRYKELLIA